MNRNIEILHKSIEKLGKVALINIEKQQFIATINILSEINRILLKFLHLKSSNLKSFIQKFISIEENQNLSQEIKNAQSEFINLYVNTFFVIWKDLYDRQADSSAIKVVDLFSDVFHEYLTNYVQDKENYIPNFPYSDTQIFLFFFQRLGVEIDEAKLHVNKYHGYTYRWFFDFVFDEEFNIKRHITIFQVSLFISIRNIIKNKNRQTFKSFIETIINGMWYPEYGLLPDIDIDTKASQRVVTKEYEEIKNKLITASIEALNLKDYEALGISMDAFSTIITKYDTLSDELRSTIVSKYQNFIEQQFKYNILKQTVIWLGVYALFIREYGFIDDLLFYNQPKDSSVDWVNRDINPLTIQEIFSFYHRRFELENNITFMWDAHHEFMPYYKTYLGILLINAVNQNRRKGKSWQNEYHPDLKPGDKSTQEIENIARTFEDLKKIIESLTQDARVEKDPKDKGILEQCGLSSEAADLSVSILENILSKINRQKEEIIVSAQIDPIIADNFISNVYNQYLSTGSIRNIINFYNPIEEINNAFPGKTFLPFAINEISIKAFFDKNDKGTYIGWGESFARRFTFSENLELKRIFIEGSKKYDSKYEKSKIIEELESTIGNLEDKVLIFSNLFPSYDIFGETADFKPKEELPEYDQINSHEFVGRYKGSDVFTYYDETKWKSLLVLKKTPESGVGTIKFYVPTEDPGFNIKGHFYWKILDLNLENTIVEQLIKEQPYWLVKETPDEAAQRKFLSTQVDIIIIYRMNLELPSNFEGWFFTF